MENTVVISDLHIGSKIFKPKVFNDFINGLKRHFSGQMIYEAPRIIVNGDLFHKDKFKIKPDILSSLLNLVDYSERYHDVIVLQGNHDGEMLREFCENSCIQRFSIFKDGDNLFLHGDVLDRLVTYHPILTNVAIGISDLLQFVDRSNRIGKLFKKKKLKFAAIELAKQLQCERIFCGHTHTQESYHLKATNITYYNSGSFAESPHPYITVTENKIELRSVD